MRSHFMYNLFILVEFLAALGIATLSIMGASSLRHPHQEYPECPSQCDLLIRERSTSPARSCLCPGVLSR